ncbi:MAG: hypothetical protein RSC24_06190 [Clostridium sp.]
MSKIKPINYTEKLCFKCLEEKDNIHKYEINYRGYGSVFDGEDTFLQLCDCCNDNRLNEWFNEQPKMEDYYEEYEFEELIHDFIRELPIQGRELFDNQCVKGWGSHQMQSQDWLDVELGIAPDRVYKKYNLYSPSEKNAYKERFSTCKKVYLKVYSDRSSHTKCDFGASGEKDGSCGMNTSSSCYYCEFYEKKGTETKMEEKIDMTLSSDELKIVEMNEWTCKKCGNINHTYAYKEYLYCSKCGEEHFIV